MGNGNHELEVALKSVTNLMVVFCQRSQERSCHAGAVSQLCFIYVCAWRLLRACCTINDDCFIRDCDMLINYIKKLSGGEGCQAERPLRATAHVSCVSEGCEFECVC